MRSGKWSASQIAEAYLRRIEGFDKPAGRIDAAALRRGEGSYLNSIIELNPAAMAIAEERDRERKSGKIRGPLHGIPVLIKDNIDTADRMRTTAGSLRSKRTSPDATPSSPRSFAKRARSFSERRISPNGPISVLPIPPRDGAAEVDRRRSRTRSTASLRLELRIRKRHRRQPRRHRYRHGDRRLGCLSVQH